MPKLYENIKIPDPSEGVIRASQMSEKVAPENSVQLGVNVVYDRIGAFMTRLGVSTYATALAGAIKTFGRLSIQSSGVRQLLAQVAGVVTFWNGTTWGAVHTYSAAANKVRYSQFLNKVYMVNGNAGISGETCKTWDGTTFGANNVDQLPAGDFVQAGFDGRVWIGDASNDRLSYSNVVTLGGLITTGNPPGSAAEYIETLSPQDGESMTALQRVPKALLVFKQNHIFRVYSPNAVDAYPAYNVGTFSAESVIETKDGIYFHHSSGFYRFNYNSFNSQPTEISRRIRDFVLAIPRSYYENVHGTFNGLDAVEWGIGPVTVDGVTFKNCIVRFSISTQVWTIFDLAGNDCPSAMIKYDDSNFITPIVGTTTGKIGRLENGTTDFGQKIYFEQISRFYSFTELIAREKAVSGMSALATNGGGANLQYQIDKKTDNEWETIGKYKPDYATLFPNANSSDFNRIRFRTSGFTTGPQMVFEGLEILKLQEKGYNEN